MWKEALAFFCSLYSVLYQAIVPCSFPEVLPANTVDRQQYLGTWFFKAAVSHREADIQKFRALDNCWFTMKETANDTLLLTGHMRVGDDCINQTWTYHIHPERDDLELEGKKERRSLLWSGKWANCPECIVFQEVEPPLHETDSQDSLSRLMLYTREKDVDPKMVTAFLKNAACHNMSASVKLPLNKVSPQEATYTTDGPLPPLSTRGKKTLHCRPMTKGKPCQTDMSLTERQQINLDTESSAHSR
uniref:apolipoprotein M n=1 Tax=Semicossyphus pulcher TaxID=241346 RepID=UPI0037E990C5